MKIDLRGTVERYFEYWAKQRTASEAEFDVWMEVTDLVDRDPDTAWPLICALIEQAPGDDALSYVAAGPLEQFLIRHGDRWLSKVRGAGTTSARFRKALAGVWGRDRMSDAVRNVVERFQERAQ